MISDILARSKLSKAERIRNFAKLVDHLKAMGLTDTDIAMQSGLSIKEIRRCKREAVGNNAFAKITVLIAKLQIKKGVSQ